jgi:glycosyltransferase involved in cell wall biosynthesis
MEYPRLLVATSNNFNLSNGGGITLTNLFGGWPMDRIASVHEDPQPEDHSVCRLSYRLSGNEIQPVAPFSWLLGSSSGDTGALTPTATSAESPLAKFSRTIFGNGIPRRAILSPEFRKWLDAFQPEVVYSFLGSMAQIRLTAAIVKQYNCALAVHIMDDWPGVIYTSGFLGAPLRRRVLSEFQALLNRASVRLAISEDMCTDYKQRFGVEFRAFHNAVDTAEWLSRGRTQWKLGKPFIVRYAGSIIQESQRDAIRDIAEAVSTMRKAGTDIELWIHAPAIQRSYLQAYGFEGLHLCDSPESASVIELLASADLLVLPFNFDQASAEYMRLSMSTKIPAYMASGTPILAYGPDSIAQIRYAMREGWAHVLFRPGADLLREALAKLMESSSLREAYARRAQHVAVERHDSPKIREAFQSALRNAVTTNGV